MASNHPIRRHPSVIHLPTHPIPVIMPMLTPKSNFNSFSLHEQAVTITLTVFSSRTPLYLPERACVKAG